MLAIPRVESSTEIETIDSLLRYRAEWQGDELAYAFLENGEGIQQSSTYRQLHDQALMIARNLSNYVQPGDRVILLFPAGVDVIAAFFATLYCGAIPILNSLPHLNRHDKRFSGVVRNSQPAALLTLGEKMKNQGQWRKLNPVLEKIPFVAANDSFADIRTTFDYHDSSTEALRLALLQYTSGSTSAPKGVMVGHDNLLNSLSQLHQGWGHTQTSTMVTWLPFFHDMGLIYTLLMPIYAGFRCYVMSPAAFVQTPFRWLKAISDYSGTHTAAPNFAYDLCLQSISPSQRDQLDLSTWKVALNAAEKVNADTIAKFTDYFSPVGLNSTTIRPGYGLAEMTLKATSLPLGSPLLTLNLDAQALADKRVVKVREINAEKTKCVLLTACGWPEKNSSVCIVNPDSCELVGSNQVGEICLAGDAMAKGYWNNPKATKNTFGFLPNFSGDRSAEAQVRLDGPLFSADKNCKFLRTGDLGFIAEGQLFVTGRIKEIIVIRGQNYYPQDIEQTVSASHPALKGMRGGAFSIEDQGQEKLALVYEVSRHYVKKFPLEEVSQAVEHHVFSCHGLNIFGIVFVRPGSCPKTTSGKIQRYACRTAFIDGSLPALGSKTFYKPRALESAISDNIGCSTGIRECWLISQVAEILALAPASIDRDQPLASYGLDSLSATKLAGTISEECKRKFDVGLIYSYPTIAKLNIWMANGEAALAPPVTENYDKIGDRIQLKDVAVIGMSCRFPGAKDIEAFWRLLKAGDSALSSASQNSHDSSVFAKRDFLRKYSGDSSPIANGGFLTDVDRFDAEFFDISRLEAEQMDPQQRHILELAWWALENAGIAPSSLKGSKTGVFTALANNDYIRSIFRRKDTLNAYTGTGNSLAIAANRLSWFFDWHGPSLNIDTACSSSLVAIHTACKSLLSGECSTALVAAANLILSPEWSESFNNAKMLSPTGKCHTFDASADGYVRSEGGGALVLKKLGDAQRDGDPILAVIKGGAINQDGKSNGLTAPNGLAQQALYREALKYSGIEAKDVSYVEAHGTGTPLGDPIELSSLQSVYGKHRATDSSVLVGSVKTNIGHLESAAGMAGAIKAILALERKKIPANLHFKDPNPAIDWASLAIAVPTSAVDWPNSERKIAAVSSFGFGGTNAHIILEKYSNTKTTELSEVSPAEPRAQMIALSAKSESALLALRQKYCQWLDSHPDIKLDAIATTTHFGREHFSWRMTASGATHKQMRQSLANAPAKKILPNGNKVAFLFTGQGCQYINMGGELYRDEPVFAQAFDQCCQLFAQATGVDLLAIIEAGEELDQTAFSQPAIFSIQIALLALWRKRGIEPSWVLGHSVGEYAAAVCSGVITVEQGMTLVVARGKIMQSMPQCGAMAVAFCESSRVEALIKSASCAHGDVAIAAYNTPKQTVLSGEQSRVDEILSTLDKQGVSAAVLNVSHAFHSPLMAPAALQFRDVVAAQFSRKTANKPNIPFISTVRPLEKFVVLDERYWSEHITQPVMFQQGMQTLYELGARRFLELGPMPVLSNMGKSCLENCVDKEEAVLWASSIQGPGSGSQDMLEQLGALYQSGVRPSWQALNDRGLSRQTLPLYPFSGESYWHNNSFEKPVENYAENSRKALPRCGREKLWQSKVVWEAQSPHEAPPIESQYPDANLVVIGHSSQCEDFQLYCQAQEISCVNYPELFTSDDMAEIFYRQLKEDNVDKNICLVYFSTLVGADSLDKKMQAGDDEACIVELERVLKIFQLVKTLSAQVKLFVVTQGAVATADGLERTGLMQAPIWGFARCASLELPDKWGGLFDLPNTPSLAESHYLALTKWIFHRQRKRQTALRQSHYYSPKLIPQEAIDVEGGLEASGLWLITGGCGALGLSVAGLLAARGVKNIALCSRGSANAEALAVVKALSEQGLDITVHQANVCDYDGMQRLINSLRIQCDISGIVHAAGVLGYDELASMDTTRLREVVAAKISGASILHRLSLELKLKHFVLFSSISAVWGSKSQSHYGAGNHFLDALVSYRQNLGHPALAINWGPWSEIGMASASASFLHSLHQQGVAGLTTDEALSYLAGILSSAEGQRVVADVNWHKFAPLMGLYHEQDFFAAMLEQTKATDVEDFVVEDQTAVDISATVSRLSAGDKKSYIQSVLKEILRKQLNINVDEFPVHSQGFTQMGVDSLRGTALMSYLEKVFHLKLAPTFLLDVPNYPALVDYVAASSNAASTLNSVMADDTVPEIESEAHSSKSTDIAIVGIACRFPAGIHTPKDLWQLLDKGEEVIRPTPSERKGLYGDLGSLSYGGFIDDIAAFDAALFGLSEAECKSLDPQHRLLLEVAWEAVENAGEAISHLKGTNTGVFVGITSSDYRELIAQQAQGPENYYVTGNTANAAAGRLSYLMGLTGPSMSIDTACSSSLAAVHTACQMIISGGCEQAIVGGVNVNLSATGLSSLQQTGALAPDGRCKSFDASADGYGRSEGCGVLMLKPLDHAKRDNNTIHAVIAGSAMNQDGDSAGLTTPSQKAQQCLIQEAVKQANIAPQQLDYIEAHGTGTVLGDPIEIKAIAQTLGRNRSKPLWVGSVKSNLGHMESAAGMGSLFKVILSLKHNRIPKSLHIEHPNPHVPWDDMDIALATESQAWPPNNQRYAGVSGFGLSGTNVHIILTDTAIPQEQPTVSGKRGKREKSELFVLSAHCPAALAKKEQELAMWLENNRQVCPATLAKNLAYSRTHFRYRSAFIARDLQYLIDLLYRRTDSPPATNTKKISKIKHAWLEGGDLPAHNGEPYQRLNLPTYPFQRKNYWCSAQPIIDPNDDCTTLASHTQWDAIVAGELEVALPIVASVLRREVSQVMGISIAELEGHHPGFFQLGMDSMMATNLRIRFEKLMKKSLPSTLLLDYPNIADLSEYIYEQTKPSELETPL